MFEKRLRALREEQGFQSQQALANALGVAQSTVANWECGRREPNYETTKRLAELFQVTVDYLMGRGGERPRPQGRPAGRGRRAVRGGTGRALGGRAGVRPV